MSEEDDERKALKAALRDFKIIVLAGAPFSLVAAWALPEGTSKWVLMFFGLLAGCIGVAFLKAKDS